MCLICLVLGLLIAKNSFLKASLKFGAPSLIKVFGLLPVTSLPCLNNGLMLAVYFVSATCYAIQNLVSSSISAYRYFIFPLTLTYNSSVLQALPTLGFICSRYPCINPTYLATIYTGGVGARYHLLATVL